MFQQNNTYKVEKAHNNVKAQFVLAVSSIELDPLFPFNILVCLF